MADITGLSVGRPVGALDPAQVRRYARHLSLTSFGPSAQEKLAAATVLVVGAGGLGSPVLLYLAAAGVGTIHVADDDSVDESNLQRQVLHGESDIGLPKVESAVARLRDVNPLVAVVQHQVRVTAENVAHLVGPVDLVVDCSDNFPTRYLLNDACVDAGIPCVWGSVHEFDGQVAVWWGGRGPCYRCLHPVAPPEGLFSSCEDAGVLGSVCGVVGGLQATEAIKILSGVGDPLVGRMLVFDALSSSARTIVVTADPACPGCGTGRARAAAPTGEAWTCASGERTDDDALEIEPEALLALLAAGADFTLVDCRDGEATEPLAGAIHVPLRRLAADPSGVAGEGLAVVYCEVGRSSLVAVSALRGIGRPARSLRGGLAAWRGIGALARPSLSQQAQRGTTMTDHLHSEEKHGCDCGHETSATPELDARLIPHEVRHAAILGALDSLKPGAALILVAPHDPKPLLAQVDAKYGDSFAREYVQSGPDAWKIRFERAAIHV